MKAYIITVTVVLLVIIFAVQAQINTVQSNDALAKKSGCIKCHSSVDNKKAIGPTFNDIAAKYKNNLQATDTLIAIIKNGSKGNWTQISKGVPMPPYSGRLTDAQIGGLVEWMLHL
jgi:cytochrome c551/c552